MCEKLQDVVFEDVTSRLVDARNEPFRYAVALAQNP